jgi:uncharacterized protein (TIRG00374 family)
VVRRRTVLLALAVGLPASALFLWLALRGADLGEVRSALGNATLAPLLLADAAFVVLYAAQAERWRRIAGCPLRWRAFAAMVVGGIACNNVLPARVGDLLRSRWLARSGGLTAGRGLATVALDRACDVAVLFVLLLVALPEVAGSGWSRNLAFATAVLVLAIVVLVASARVYAARRARSRLRSRSRLRGVVRDVVDGLAEPMGARRLLEVFALSAVAWLAFAAAAFLVARSVGVHLGVADALLTTAVVNLGVAIPSSPGFVGTYQWLGVASLGLAGIDKSPALAFAVLLQAAWYVPTTVIGAGLLLAHGARATRAARVMRPGTGSAS